MRKLNMLLITVIALLLCKCGARENCIDFGKIEIVNDTAYYNGSLFSGVSCEYDSGVKIGEYHISDGVLYYQEVFCLQDCTMLSVGLKENLWDGEFLLSWPDSSKFIGKYKKGYLDGEGKTFYPNGRLFSVKNYLKGCLDGSIIVYDSAGNMKESGYYKMDKKDSIWTYWNDSIPKYELFSNGESVLSISFNSLDYKPIDTNLTYRDFGDVVHCFEIEDGILKRYHK